MTNTAHRLRHDLRGDAPDDEQQPIRGPRLSLEGIYLVDDRGRRYPPTPDASARSLTAELEPGQAVTTRRVFALPPDARATGFVVQRGGGSPLRCLIIGGPCWFTAPKNPRS